MRTLAACALPFVLVACPVLWSAASAGLATGERADRMLLADLALGWRGTLVWSLPVALSAALLGWIPGRALRARIATGKGMLLAVAITWVALMPPYALFYCGWRLCRPGTAVADWAAMHGYVGTLRAAVLWMSLLTWLWPISAITVASLAPTHPADADEAARLDSRTAMDRVSAAWRRDWRALVVAVIVMAVALIGETTAFDVAQVVTASSELRLLDAAGATAATLWSVASVPSAAAVLLVAGSICAWRMRSSRRDPDTGAAATQGRSGTCRDRNALGIAVVAALAGGAVAVPLALLAADGMSSGAWASFSALHGRAAAGALSSALIGGSLGALAAGVACVAALGSRPTVSVALAGMAWAVGAALPGVLMANAYESMWNGLPPLRWVYDSMLLVPLAQVAHAGLACWMLGCLMASRVSRDAVDAERIHGTGAWDLVRAHTPCIAAAALGGGMAMAAHCVSETAIASRLLPPGAERIAPMLMNAIHYQDQSAVLAAMPWMAGLAAIMAAVAVTGWGWMRRAGRVRVNGLAMMVIAAAAACALGSLGCDGRGDSGAESRVRQGMADGADQVDPLDRGGAGFGAMASAIDIAEDAPPPLSCEQVLGMRGRMPGRLDYPRAADMGTDGTVVVIDKSGRVQRFAPDGSLLSAWRMPRTESGMPTGVTVDRHGRLWIADTHEHRVLVCAPDGTELGSFGRYGRGPGELVYPTDVLMLDDSDAKRCAIVVSEYGGNDRLQWFDVSIGVDGFMAATPLRSVGSQGSGVGQFLRPQSMSRMADGSIAVADACNHRIVMLSADGQWLRTIGQPGRELGQLAYPYGVLACGSGGVLVAEFGNNRIQRLDASGRGVWMRGGGGREMGRLVAPWAIVGDASAPFVVDAGNCRIVRVRLPADGER